jgi:anti-anti-sigma regulatory factor
MTPVAEWIKIDADRISASMQDAAAKLQSSQGEVVLDFSAVQRIDAGSLMVMEKITDVAGERKVRIILRGVNVDVYKVLKLAKLTSRFIFC